VGRDFPYLSSPALGPTQFLAQWVPGLSRGKERLGRDADSSLPSSAVVMKDWSYTSTSPMGRTACTESQCLYKGAIYTLNNVLTTIRCDVDWIRLAGGSIPRRSLVGTVVTFLVPLSEGNFSAIQPRDIFVSKSNIKISTRSS
jgi:hypothetical protein